MPSFNKVVLVGNVTRDVELRHIPSGMAVTEIGLAVNDRVKKGEQWVDEVTFVDCTLWGRTAEVACEYLSKGASVLIEGRLKLETWEKEGQKHSKLKVVGEKMQMLGAKTSDGVRKPDAEQREPAKSSPKDMAIPARSGATDPDDIPF